MTITHPGASSIFHNITNACEITAKKLKDYEVDQKQREDIREALRDYMMMKPLDSMERRIALGFLRALGPEYNL